MSDLFVKISWLLHFSILGKNLHSCNLSCDVCFCHISFYPTRFTNTLLQIFHHFGIRKNISSKQLQPDLFHYKYKYHDLFGGYLQNIINLTQLLTIFIVFSALNWHVKMFLRIIWRGEFRNTTVSVYLDSKRDFFLCLIFIHIFVNVSSLSTDASLP